MKTSDLQKAIIGAILRNRPDPSDFDSVYQQLNEPTTIQAFGRSVGACLRRGWLKEKYWTSPPQGDGAPTRELIVTPSGELAYAGGDLSPQVNRAEWKDVRAPFIGSSDVGPILGISDYRGPWDVWDRIVLGKWDDDDREAGGDIRRGNRQEQNALDRFEEVYGIEYVPQDMMHHPEHYELVTDVDGMIPPENIEWPEEILSNPLWEPIIEAAARGESGALEVKCPRTSIFYDCKETGLRLDYVVQMQHHLAVGNHGWGIFVLYDAQYDDVHAFPVMPHPKFIDQILTMLPRWYQQYVVGNTRPVHPEPAPAEWPERPKGTGTVVEDPELREQFELTKIRYWEMTDAQQQYADQEKALLDALKDREEQLLISDGVKVTRYSTSPRRQFDRKALRAAIVKAQQEGDEERLFSIDPDSDEFYYLTDAKTKEEVKVFATPEQEG